MIFHPARHLTSNYKKDSDSNNYKLLNISHLEHLEILENLNKVEASRDIDEADGFTLDKAGKNVLELRDGRDDETFRQAIKIKIRGNLSSGTIEDINSIATILFGESYISVLETWSVEEYDCEPAALLLSISDDPEAQERFLYYMKVILMAVKAGGVRLYNKIMTQIPPSVIYAGTTSFDRQQITVPPRTLENQTVHGMVYTGTTYFDRQYIGIPPRTLENQRVSGKVHVVTTSYDCQHLAIPPRTLENQTIHSIVYYASCLYGDYSLMEIPTKALREGYN